MWLIIDDTMSSRNYTSIRYNCSTTIMRKLRAVWIEDILVPFGDSDLKGDLIGIWPWSYSATDDPRLNIYENMENREFVMEMR